MQEYTFDLQRILLGDLPLLFVLEIALRTTSMLLYALFLLRLLGTTPKFVRFLRSMVL